MKSTRDPVDHVKVCCRVRPLNSSEKQLHKDLCVAYPSRSTDTIVCNTGTGLDGNISNSGIANDAGSNAERHAFTFSRVFRPEAGQADVYEHVAQPIVTDVMAGYNGTIFMYGQTGSGKTHTMFGDLKGGAWSMKEGVASSTRSSTALPAENVKDANEEEVGEADQNGDGHYNDDGNTADEREAEEEQDDDEELARSSVRAAPASSFSRSGATVTPLGELRQVNTLQTKAGMSAYHLKGTAKATKPGLGLPRHSSSRPPISATQERRHRAAFSKDAMSGVIPRAVQDIFQAIADADPSTEFDVQMFFVEVYMEQIRDLLVPATASSSGVLGSRRPTRKLQLREDVATNSFYIDGCRMPHVSSAREVLQLVKTGLKYRATSATAMNETSSRSHCLLNLTVKSVNHKQCVSMVGKLYLVDLAGSEKVGKTNATGLRLEEAKLINKSLSTLGMVIMSLTDQTTTHTPYRNSVLTKILKDSLGGNSHTALVICCSPSPYNASETLSTLRFGARAKAIENNAVVNRELTAAQLKRMLDSAKEEIERLHSKLRQLAGSEKNSSSGAATLYDSYAVLTALSGGSVHDCSGIGGLSANDLPAPATRKLSDAAVASSSAFSTPADARVDGSRISALLEERASEQARLQHLRADVAQLQDNLTAAQETISALQEERDGYVDRVQSLQEEVDVWESAHHDAVRRAATQAALLQQCQLLLHTQASEIRDLTKAMQDYATPLAQARAAVEHLNTCVFGPDVPSQRRRTLITAESTMSAETSCRPVRVTSEPPRHRLSTGSPAPLGEGESPNPRRQLVAEMGDTSIVLPQTSRSQQLQGPDTEGRASGTLNGLSPALAAAQEWLSRNASVERGAHEDEVKDGEPGVTSCPTRSPRPSAQAQCILVLEEQLAGLSEAHATLQQEHRNALAELQSKQRILDMRRGRLENVTEELRHACSANEELRESLEKERKAVRAPLEMARNDANYWRRRFEELANRRDQLPPRSSEHARSSLRFLFPPSSSDGGDQLGSSCSGGLGGEGRRTVSGSNAARARLSLPGSPSRATTSCRESGEDLLLSLSSHSTPIGTCASLSNYAPPPARPSAVDMAKTTMIFMDAREASPLRARSASRSLSPSANSKL